MEAANRLKIWWPGTELNRRRQPFQGCALPPELPGHIDARNFAGFVRVGRARTSAGLNDRCDWKKQSVLVAHDYNNHINFAQSRSSETARHSPPPPSINLRAGGYFPKPRK